MRFLLLLSVDFSAELFLRERILIPLYSNPSVLYSFLVLLYNTYKSFHAGHIFKNVVHVFKRKTWVYFYQRAGLIMISVLHTVICLVDYWQCSPCLHGVSRRGPFQPELLVISRIKLFDYQPSRKKCIWTRLWFEFFTYLSLAKFCCLSEFSVIFRWTVVVIAVL